MGLRSIATGPVQAGVVVSKFYSGKYRILVLAVNVSPY